MELSKHVVNFERRSTIKSQVLIDFIANWTELANYTEGPVPKSPWHVTMTQPRAMLEPEPQLS
jgi:hypothetical protein